MIDSGPFIPSIAMLAAIALASGGGWLIFKRRDRLRGALMMAMALVLLGNVLIWIAPARGRTSPPANMTGR